MLQGRYVFLASNTSVRWSISDIGMDNRGRKGIFASTMKNRGLQEGSEAEPSDMLKRQNIFAGNSQD
ncbi:hypothetical protein DQ393_22595 [Rhizobium tropici]|uniref:Uncharacterized protein n=1 Tax=Rhizobium tropici TaxID=398 RepID=A0A329YE97_RHITR|nr:hypothetical protein DQ393_22595 [Rhizobium tropici]